MPGSRRNTMEDFFNRFTIVDDEDSCWPWFRINHSHGYGQFLYEGKMYYAHVFSFIHLKNDGEPLPLGVKVCHTCDTPSCVRPSHLFKGSHKENMEDMTRKERNTQKLMASMVLDIRAEYSQRILSQREIARIYGISQTMIGYIVRREQWTHI